MTQLYFRRIVDKLQPPCCHCTIFFAVDERQTGLIASHPYQIECNGSPQKVGEQMEQDGYINIFPQLD